MAKKPLKIDSLAKLRQYTKEQDPAQFLSTEWRQVVRALEQAYVETDAPNSSTAIPAIPSGFYATDTNTYTVSSNLTFSTYDFSSTIGSVKSGYIFVPSKAGKFWIEVIPTWQNAGPSYFGGSWTSTLSIKDESGTVLKTGTFFYVHTGGSLLNFTAEGSVAVSANLTPTNGVYFSCNLTHSILSQLSFKIYRISD